MLIVLEGTLAVPVLGPLVALGWIGVSWGLPELLGVRRGESKNPPNNRGLVVIVLLFLAFIAAIMIIRVFSTE
jgi:hypothetical protein